MKYLVKLAGMAVMMLVEGLIDIAIGVVIVHLMGKAFGYNIPVWFYPTGAFLALLPDIDSFYHLIQVRRGKRKFYGTHRLIPHWPIMIIPVCIVISVWAVFFWPDFVYYWIAVAALCILGHDIHDSIGWLIKWFAPWGKYYGFFIEKDGKRHFIISMSEEEFTARIRVLKENPREGTMDRLGLHIETPKKEIATGLVILVVAVLLILFW